MNDKSLSRSSHRRHHNAAFSNPPQRSEEKKLLPKWKPKKVCVSGARRSNIILSAGLWQWITLFLSPCRTQPTNQPTIRLSPIHRQNRIAHWYSMTLVFGERERNGAAGGSRWWLGWCDTAILLLVLWIVRSRARESVCGWARGPMGRRLMEMEEQSAEATLGYWSAASAAAVDRIREKGLEK